MQVTRLRIAKVALYLALVSFAIGLFCPFFVVSRFKGEGDKRKPGFAGMLEKLVQEGLSLFVDDTPMPFSVMGGIGHLMREGSFFLGGLLLCVSVIFPAIKLAMSIVLPREERAYSRQAQMVARATRALVPSRRYSRGFDCRELKIFPARYARRDCERFLFLLRAVLLSYCGVLLSPEERTIK